MVLRSKTGNFVVRVPRSLLSDQLPTYQNVAKKVCLNCYLARKVGGGRGAKAGKDSLGIASKTVAEKAICMWRKRENSSDTSKVVLAKKCSAQSREKLQRISGHQ